MTLLAILIGMVLVKEMDDEKRRRKRFIAVVLSGVFFVVILPIIVSFVGYFFDILIRIPKIFIFPINLIIGLPFAVIGFFWGIWSNLDLFRTGKGSPVPGKDTETIFLVNSGPYKYCRNPMIFGTYFIYVGLGMLFNIMSLILIIASFMLVSLIIYVKKEEEKKLEERFGESYVQYKAKTSFIIPWIPKK